MEFYAGLNVSLELMSVCLMGGEGDPEARSRPTLTNLAAFCAALASP